MLKASLPLEKEAKFKSRHLIILLMQRDLPSLWIGITQEILGLEKQNATKPHVVKKIKLALEFR